MFGQTKRVYEWTATGKRGYEDGEAERDTVRFKGECEFTYQPGELRLTSSYVRKGCEMDAMEGAYKNGIDPDTVEVIDIVLIYE